MDVQRLETTITIKNGNWKVKILFISALFIVTFILIFPFVFRDFISNEYIQYVLSLDDERLQTDTESFKNIVVLGAGYDIVKERIDTAIEVKKSIPDAKLILSGYEIPSENYFEVTFMKSYALENGLIESDLILDPNSSRTFETCLNIKELTKGEDKVLFITSTYHLLRTLFVCRQIGLDAYGVISTNDFSKGIVESIKSNDNESIYSNIRETISLTYSIWDLIYYNLITKNFPP